MIVDFVRSQHLRTEASSTVRNNPVKGLVFGCTDG